MIMPIITHNTIIKNNNPNPFIFAEAFAYCLLFHFFSHTTVFIPWIFSNVVSTRCTTSGSIIATTTHQSTDGVHMGLFSLQWWSNCNCWSIYHFNSFPIESHRIVTNIVRVHLRAPIPSATLYLKSPSSECRLIFYIFPYYFCCKSCWGTHVFSVFLNFWEKIPEVQSACSWNNFSVFLLCTEKYLL